MDWAARATVWSGPLPDSFPQPEALLCLREQCDACCPYPPLGRRPCSAPGPKPARGIVPKLGGRWRTEIPASPGRGDPVVWIAHRFGEARQPVVDLRI